MFLRGGYGEQEWDEIRKHERSGRPLGEESFIENLERAMDRALKRLKTGPKGPRTKQIIK